MYKATSLLLVSAVLLTFLLCGCDTKVVEEPTTDNSEIIIATIDKSSPITKGNLITKSNTDENGNINVNYFDSKGNLVEQYIWSDNENIAHSVMTYSNSDLLLIKEDITPDGSKNKVESYQYDANNEVKQKTVSEFEDGRLKSSTVYNAENKITSHSLSYYNKDNLLEKIERFDDTDTLEEYYLYEYSDEGRTEKYSAYKADGSLIKYTTFEYDKKGLLESEKYFDSDDNLTSYYLFTYYDNGNMKSSASYDGEGNLKSEDFFENDQ